MTLPSNWCKTLHSTETVGWGVVFHSPVSGLDVLQNGPFNTKQEARTCLEEMAQATYRSAIRRGWRVVRMVETRTYDEVQEDYGVPTE